MIRKARNTQVTGHNFRSLLKSLYRTCIVLILSVGQAKGQNAQDTALPLKIDRAAFQRQAGPVASEGITGVLASRSGSYVRGAQLVCNSFALSGGSKGGVSVELVTFPKGYRYAPHDLFGSLSRTDVQAKKRLGPSNVTPGTDSVQCVEWEYTDHTKGGTVCYAQVAVDQKHDGVVAWFKGNADEGFVTVRIGYSNLDGLPGQVTDEYLREHPSDVPAQPTWHVDWETKDLEKWTDVLKANKDDLVMLQAGAAYLTRYEKRAFGLLDALKKRDDAAAFSQALDGVSERMSRLVDERKKAREAAQRGE
jgi:hypothetical protein